MKRPPVPVTPSNPLEEKFLMETIMESTIIMGNGWSREVELSLEAIQISSPSYSMLNPRSHGECSLQSHGRC
jgi:hypothetical protein